MSREITKYIPGFILIGLLYLFGWIEFWMMIDFIKWRDWPDVALGAALTALFFYTAMLLSKAAHKALRKP